jgi:diguanylate cyclase (GGDEF)-like protein
VPFLGADMIALLLLQLSFAQVTLDPHDFTVLDGEWELRVGEGLQTPWQSVRLPGNLSFQGVSTDGVVWYRKYFTLDATWTFERAALRVPMAANAYEVFVNGTRVGARGEIGADGSLVRKDFRSGVFAIERALLKTTGSNELMLRLRTFQGNGGVVGPGTLLGAEEPVRLEHERRRLNAAMLLSLFAFAGFFHIVLYVGRRLERHHLSFAGISFSLAGITAGINTFGYRISENPDFNAYLVFVPLLMLPFFVLRFFGDFFRSVPPVLLRLSFGLMVAQIGFLLTCTAFNGLYFWFEHVVLPMGVLLLLLAYALALYWTQQALRTGQLGAVPILIGLLAYGVTSSLELGWAFQLVPFYVDSYLGFAVFIGCMVVAISMRFAWLHRQVEIGARDSLTGCLTRHGFESRSVEAFSQESAVGKPPSVIMIDVDHFKSINDAFGHSAGDRVLKEVATRILKAVRQHDLVARWGGEEFLILIPDQDSSHAVDIAERVRVSIESIALPEASAARVTISCGIATRGPQEAFESTVSRADTALYEAKHAGRNTVRRAEESRLA